METATAPVPAVISAVKKIMSARMRPFVIGMRTRQMTAPPMIPNPIGSERIPIPIGSSPSILSAKSTESYDRELTIYVINLSGPEEKHHKVVATAKKGDKQDHDHGLSRLAKKSSWHHRVRSIKLPNEERDNEDDTEDQWCEIVSTSPRILQKISELLR